MDRAKLFGADDAAKDSLTMIILSPKMASGAVNGASESDPSSSGITSSSPPAAAPSSPSEEDDEPSAGSGRLP